MIEIHKVKIPDLSDEVRNLYIYLPTDTASEKQSRFPVLYMFDGHNVFFDSHATYGKSWGLGSYLDYTDTPLIVAAIECSHLDGARLSEYSPYSFRYPGIGSCSGQGEKTMDWIIHTLKPWVDSRYPTIPDRSHTMIGGSSMGGLMSLYAAVQHNDVFSRAAALSPSVMFSPNELDNLLNTAPLDPETVIYMDSGEKELSMMRTAPTRFRKVTDILLKRHVQLTSRIVPGGEHCEACWERQIPFFLPVLLYGMNH